jgi:hypothetical protein
MTEQTPKEAKYNELRSRLHKKLDMMERIRKNGRECLNQEGGLENIGGPYTNYFASLARLRNMMTNHTGEDRPGAAEVEEITLHTYDCRYSTTRAEFLEGLELARKDPDKRCYLVEIETMLEEMKAAPYTEEALAETKIEETERERARSRVHVNYSQVCIPHRRFAEW